MASVDEAAKVQSPINAALKQGITTVSESQEIVFTLYVRLVLPLDGYVFWVKADLVSESALANAMGINEATLNQPMVLETAARTFIAQGSLHYYSEKSQDEDQNYAINRMVFTAEKPIDRLNQVGPDTLWIGEYNGLRFAFGTHALLYAAAGLWHYQGDAVYPDMSPQLIDKVSTLSEKQIVSNSLPLWLAMNGYSAQIWETYDNDVPMYPSYLLPANIKPPWASVHIAPESTVAIQTAPYVDLTSSRWQLVRETVRITLFGLNNDQALDFADFVQQYVQNYETFGIMNLPVIRDEKRTQSELSTISQKKTIEYEVNYYQARSNQIARALIEQAIPTFFISGVEPPVILLPWSMDFSDPDNSGNAFVLAGF